MPAVLALVLAVVRPLCYQHHPHKWAHRALVVATAEPVPVTLGVPALAASALAAPVVLPLCHGHLLLEWERRALAAKAAR